MSGMPAWEYAELRWASGRKGVTWYTSDEERQGDSENGLEALQRASEEGWEVVGYFTAPRGESKCLLKRRVD